jgi:predicted dehydrogenase
MKQAIRMGLVGYGFGGRYFHAPLIASAPECELVAVATSSPERKALVASEHPGVPTVSSLQAMAELGVEAVTVCTPLASHTALTEQALELGLAVVCDKPFAWDAPAARATVELAARRGLALSPYQNRRWDSDFLTVRRLVAENALGTVTRFESRFERYAPDRGPGSAGGGTLLDFCSHLADQALVLLGPVSTVFAHSRQRDSGLDDDVFIVLLHESGAESHLTGGWRQYAAGPRFRVTGTTGTYIVAAGDTQEDQLIAGNTPARAGESWGEEPSANWGRLFRAQDSEPVRSERGAWDAFYPAFAAAVRGDDPPPVPARDAVSTASVLDAAKVSVTTRRAVALGSP